MRRLPKFIEDKFTIFCLIFYTNALGFESLFNGSEGELGATVTYSPLSPILSLLQHGIFLVALFFLLARWQNSLRVIGRNKFLWPLIGLVLVSFLWSDFPDLTQRRSLAFLETCTFGVYFGSRYSLKEQLKLLGWAVGIVAILCFLYTLALPGRGIETGIHAGAWRAIFVQKNLFARLMVLSSLVFLVITPNNPRQGYFLKGMVALCLVLVLLSTSKTALGIFLLMFLLFQFYQSLRWQSTVVIPFLLTTVLIGGAILTVVISNVEAIVTATGRDLTLSGRTVIWGALLDKIQERPGLGYGYVGFWHGIYGQSAYVGKVFGTTYIPPHSHNGFLELALAFGLVGILFFSLSYFSILRRAIIAARFTKTAEGLWPILYLSFLILYNQTESTLVEHNSIFWVLYVTLAISRFTPFNPEENDKKTVQGCPEKSINLMTN